MKTLRLVGLIGIAAIALSCTAEAAGHGGGGGGFGGFAGGGGGHGGGSRIGGGARPGAAGLNGGRPGYYYSRGMHYVNSHAGQFRSPVRQSHSLAGSNRGATNSAVGKARTSVRPTLNGRTDHIAERHNAANWHNDWDRRHSHFFHHRFFVFDDGFWFGLDPGFFPWDYYPYYAYDYYPYDYYPGYYADVEPYYYNEGVYSNTPTVDSTVNAVQTKLSQLGYYNGQVDGIYGPTTRDAVANYQIAQGLDVTGSLSPDTLQSLGLPIAGRTQAG